MRRRIVLAIVLGASLGTALPAFAERKILVMQSEGRADAKLRAKIDAAVLRLARSTGEDVSASDITFVDAAAAVGCKPEEPSCKDEVLGMLTVDEIVLTSAMPKPGGLEVSVRRISKGGGSRDATSLVAPDKLDTLEAIAPLFSAKAAPPATAKPPPPAAPPPPTAKQPPPAAPPPATAKQPPPAAPPPAKTAPPTATAKTAPPPGPPAPTTPPPAAPATTAPKAPPVLVGPTKPAGPATPPAPTPGPTPAGPQLPPPAVATTTQPLDQTELFAPRPETAQATPAPAPVIVNPIHDEKRDEPAPSRRWQKIGMVGGAALLVAGFIFWGSAATMQAEIDDAPTNTKADLRYLQDLERYGDRYALAGNLLTAGGAVLGGVSLYLFIRKGRAQSSTSARIVPTVFDHGAGIAFRFGGSP